MNFPNRVLVVDDDPLQLEILERAFNSFGAVEVAKASDGYEAKLLIEEVQQPFGLIVLDFCLPDFDGFEMLNYFNNCGSETRFVLLSGMPQYVLDKAEKLSEMRKLRLIGTLQKPISISELMDVVKGQNWTSELTSTASGILQSG
jgi:DNA-binding NtrC family response regulator